MTTKCYFLDFCPEVSAVIAYLAESSFCLIHEVTLRVGGYIALTIECRDADLATVERVLAPYV